jgi:hypothetical protein
MVQHIREWTITAPRGMIQETFDLFATFLYIKYHPAVSVLVPHFSQRPLLLFYWATVSKFDHIQPMSYFIYPIANFKQGQIYFRTANFRRECKFAIFATQYRQCHFALISHANSAFGCWR